MTIPDATWNKYLNLRGQGLNMTHATRAVGVSYASAKASERMLANDSGRVIREANEQASLPEPVGLDALSPEARRALDDFGFFRARYLGRISTPWQEEAASKVVELLATKRKEYLVSCAPPGSGKSTLWTLDIPLWITCRNRAIRGMIGSASQTLAERYVVNVRTVLESPYTIRVGARADRARPRRRCRGDALARTSDSSSRSQRRCGRTRRSPSRSTATGR